MTRFVSRVLDKICQMYSPLSDNVTVYLEGSVMSLPVGSPVRLTNEHVPPQMALSTDPIFLFVQKTGACLKERLFSPERTRNGLRDPGRAEIPRITGSLGFVLNPSAAVAIIPVILHVIAIVVAGTSFFHSFILPHLRIAASDRQCDPTPFW